MPDPKKVHDVLTAAGFEQSKASPQKVGQRARDIPGFKIQTLGVERRALYVFHVGKGERIIVPKYERALRAAGYRVDQERRGLRVETYRTPLDRGKR